MYCTKSRRSWRSASRAGTTRLVNTRRRPRSRISMPGGPWYIALYGLIGKVTSWSQWSPMLFDAVAHSWRWSAGLLLIRPNIGRLALMLIVLLTYWPLHLYLPLAMQEPFHHAVAVMLAGIFYRLLVHEGKVPLRLLGAALGRDPRRSPRAAHLGIAPATSGDDHRGEAVTRCATGGSRFRQVARYWPLLVAGAVVAGIFLLSRYVAAPFPHRNVPDVQLLLRSPN